MAIRSSTITLEAGGKEFKAYLAEPEAGGGPGILFLHAWWGLKPFFKEVCDRLAAQGFVVLAPDMREGRIASTIDEAKSMMEKSDMQQVGKTVMAAKTYLLHYPGLKGRKIATLGYSMGGQWAAFVAAHTTDEVAAVVLYYGAADEDFNDLHAKVLGHFSDVDEWEEYPYVQAMEQKMKAAGVDVTLHTYPGLAHWWVEEDRPEYDAKGAKLAWDRTITFLKSVLMPTASY